ncbi:MAG: helix-turn-helix transcriptional regulator [Clostridia bacterium]|nr:helix-turn-helix transcriptional regulator [Clostridia bacterium]
MEKEERHIFIERISKLRVDNNLSARKLSLAIGKNPGYINKLESEKDFLPTIDTLFDILGICKTTPAEFFYDSPSQYKKDKEIIDLLSTVDEDIKQAIITMLKKVKK